MSKQDELLERFSRARVHEEAVSVERVHFYKTDRRVNPKQEEPFWVAIGKIPVLVSAPHAVRHCRQKKIKMSDEFTGALAFLLNQMTECHGIAATKLYGGDPNVDNPCVYKEKIIQICRQHQVKLILDLHGAARERNFDVDFGTNGGSSLLNVTKILGILEKQFYEFGLTRISRDYFAAKGPNTITSFVARELKIPAVQIEVNKHYRVPAQNPFGFHRVLGALAESVKVLSQV